MKKKILAALLAATLALSLTACGGGSSESGSMSGNGVSKEQSATENEKQNIVLSESGYTVIDDGYGNVYAYYGATVTNPNKNYAMQFPVITITAKGEDGSIIGTQDQTLLTIAAEDTISFGSVVDCNGVAPATVEISANCPSSGYIPADSSGVIKSSDLAVANTSEIAGEYGDTSYTGEVTNNTDSELTMVAVTVILKNNGQIVYGDTTYVNNLAAGSTSPFEISDYNVPEHTEFVISVQNWS